MLNFETTLPLRRFFELNGILNKGQKLMCIDHHPCEFISQREGEYKRYEEDEGIVMTHYRVRFTTDKLYPKGKIKDCFETELKVLLVVNTC